MGGAMDAAAIIASKACGACHVIPGITGAVGVVGARRMDYRRIVPVVEFIGDTLTEMSRPE